MSAPAKGRSELFEGYMAKGLAYCVHKHAVARRVWGYGSPGKFYKLDAQKLLLKPFLGKP